MFCCIKVWFMGYSRIRYPDMDNRPCSRLLEICQNVVRRRIKTAHKIKDQLMFQIVNHAMYTCIKFSVRSRKIRENVA